MDARPAARASARAGASAARRFLGGAGLVLRGFALWRTRPALMLLGMVPPLIVFTAGVAMLVAAAFGLGPLATWATPLADDWDAGWAAALRTALAAVAFVGLVALGVLAFTGLTLAVGDPFYERIWRETETLLGDAPHGAGLGFGRALRDALLLVLAAIGVGALVFLLGLIPVVGGVLGPVVGTVLSGRILAAELVARPLEARGIGRRESRAVLRGSRAEQLGFGVATQLLFLVPLGAIVTVPAAVSGATLLARTALARAAETPEPVSGSSRR
ncbi:hypothetical protein GCM10027515_32920 [Schumannella luteola]|uniref:CysZ protein n=1 Tax=Schumannella luteola TaxID=472059 RepID=A0A852YIG8_9MICO|nr:EI24 domain-containing protein [Schumannella luteola]NYG98908.1 CysZ protein [Schumannella luteola]TPX06286.1 EI24 domain-containing protein [Schumannella luteola]